MADIEKARERLLDAAGVLNANAEYMSQTIRRYVQSHLNEALRALDGDGAEETWEAMPFDGSWAVFSVGSGCRMLVLERLPEGLAKRIARTTALERAVATVVVKWRNGRRVHMDDMDALANVVEAIKEGQ